jgi:6-phosphogluconate dehydrogenase (decarboxylating)
MAISAKCAYFPTVQEFWVCVPAIEQQHRIADKLRSRLELAAAVLASANEQLQMAERLSAALLAQAFEQEPD